MEVVICKRRGYFDMFSMETFDFIVRDAKADEVNYYGELRDSLLEITVEKKRGVYDLNVDDYLIFPEYDQIVVNYEVDINLPFIGYKKKIKTSAVIGAHGEVIHDNIRFKISAVTFYDSTHTGLTLYSDQMKEGYLNLEQEFVIPPWYDFVMVDPNEPNFINIVSEKGEGFYWKDRLILEPIYDAVRPTEHLDYAGEANLENVWDYVEHSGKLILKNTK